MSTPESLDDLLNLALSGVQRDAGNATLAIASRGGPEALAALSTIAARGDEHARANVAESLPELRDDVPGVARLLTTLLDDPSAMVRWTTLESIATAHAQVPLEKLISILTGDPEWVVRATGAETLGELGEKASVPALFGALSDEYDSVRAYAALSIGLLGSSGDVQLLRERLADNSERVNAEIFAAMYRLGDGSALDGLLAIDVGDEALVTAVGNVIQDLVSRDPPASLQADGEKILTFLDGFEIATRTDCSAIREKLSRLH